MSLIVATLGSGLVSASRAQGLSGQLAWLILLLEATGSQTKGQGPPGGAQGRDLREQGVCDLFKMQEFWGVCVLVLSPLNLKTLNFMVKQDLNCGNNVMWEFKSRVITNMIHHQKQIHHYKLMFYNQNCTSLFKL